MCLDWENDTESVVSSAQSDNGQSSGHSAVEGTLISMVQSQASGSTQPRPSPIVHQVLNGTHAARNPLPHNSAARRGPPINGTLPNVGVAGRSHLPPGGQSSSFLRSNGLKNGRDRANTGTGTGSNESSAGSGENVPPSSRWQSSGDKKTGLCSTGNH
ncbi:hypothetical protein ONS95_012047 [Cadophora gregata]|uniref:uncharacterized protein n=1 Tax=Cadophora gregata TaxID=51156 RepID=UPI0026DAE86C|nr:uncharacterized protein ONS95_012047 [Cadophora gregata]KAK0117720.1 hypothetical protein ONS95_012047 [Cadophora gregata]